MVKIITVALNINLFFQCFYMHCATKIDSLTSNSFVVLLGGTGSKKRFFSQTTVTERQMITNRLHECLVSQK